MPGSTINAGADASVTLGSGGYASPLTITAAGEIRPLLPETPGLVAKAAGDSIQNAGGIYGGLDGDNGVDLAGGAC